MSEATEGRVMTGPQGEIARGDPKRNWPHHAALPAEKMRDPVNREAIFCARFKEQSCLCYYCQNPMLLVISFKGSKQPPNLCTIEHLNDRYDLMARRKPVPSGGERRLVASCYECNMRRSAERTAAQPIEELRCRSRPG